MFNSFLNITAGINDTVILYVAQDITKSELSIGTNDADYDVFEYKLPTGSLRRSQREQGMVPGTGVGIVAFP